ncbi:hypothetical protein, partial [Clostridium perfringens]|uniref:hypothetical protein n=1 Tax=Clostridium perfringens TaxID=1502 RepID=UPI002ACBFC05
PRDIPITSDKIPVVKFIKVFTIPAKLIIEPTIYDELTLNIFPIIITVVGKIIEKKNPEIGIKYNPFSFKINPVKNKSPPIKEKIITPLIIPIFSIINPPINLPIVSKRKNKDIIEDIWLSFKLKFEFLK